MGTGQQKNEQIVSAQADSGSMQSSQDIKLSCVRKSAMALAIWATDSCSILVKHI